MELGCMLEWFLPLTSFVSALTADIFFFLFFRDIWERVRPHRCHNGWTTNKRVCVPAVLFNKSLLVINGQDCRILSNIQRKKKTKTEK